MDPDVLYVEDGPVLTSAGTAAGIDACLHLVRTELGSEVATRSRAGWSSPRTAPGASASSSRCPCPIRPCEGLSDVM